MHSDDRHLRPGVRWILPGGAAPEAAASALPRHVALAERMFEARRGLTLRFALLAVITLFGLALLVVVGLNGTRHLGAVQTYRVERDIDLTRQAIRNAMIEVDTAARRLDYAALGADLQGDPHVALRIALDQIMAARDLSAARGDADGAVRLAVLGDEAAELLARLSGLAVGDGHDRQVIGERLHSLAAELADLRRGTMGTLHVADVQMAMLHLIRDQTIARHETLDLTSGIVMRALSGTQPLPHEPVDTLDRALIRLQTPELELLGAVDAGIELPKLAYQSLSDAIRDGFAPGLEAMARMLAEGDRDSDVVARWIAQVERSDTLIHQVLTEADGIALDHLTERIDRAGRDAIFATTSGGAVLAAFVLSILMIVRRLVIPMARLRDTLMRLAQGDLRPIEAQDTPFVDVKAVIDALRVFRIDAIRRERLRQERLELTAELTAANREMRADLEAAAALQLAQLPRPGILGPFNFSCYFRASSHLGGDSFDYFSLPDGRIMLFQLDVAGHGTAASLVGVAAHTALKRTLAEIRDDRRLVDALTGVNANWREDLPYFTAVVMGFDPTGATGTLVQAGHPYPLLVPVDGEPQRIGRGGLPVGVHAEPGYEDSPLHLGPGDRLFVYSDGIYEVENATGMIFGEDRLCAVIRSSRTEATAVIIDKILAALKSWAGTPDLDDDISLVVMERT